MELLALLTVCYKSNYKKSDLVYISKSIMGNKTRFLGYKSSRKSFSIWLPMERYCYYFEKLYLL